MFTRELIISGIFPPDPGGPAKFAYEFAEWSSRKGKKVCVIAYFDEVELKSRDLYKDFSGVSRSDSLLVRYFRMVRAIAMSARKQDSVIAVGAFLETYIASLIGHFKYIAKVPGDIVWERARNNKITELEINDFQEARLGFKYRIFRCLFTQSLKRASIVVVPSNGLFQLCIKWGIPESRLRLIGNSVDLSKYSNLNRDSFNFDVLTVCRLAPWKGVDELIETCSQNKLRLAIAGDGPARSSLERLSVSLGADVRFFGDISEQKVLELLGTTKIFVLNSYYEGLPHALVEARAAGLITVARAGTGSAEVIRDGIDGFLVKEKDRLSHAVTSAISEFNSLSKMGDLAASDTKRRFDREQNFLEILSTLAEISK